MRAIYSYGVALVIVLVLAVWLGSGILVRGGNGPGQGEKPVVSLIEKDGGPLTNATEKLNSKAPEMATRPDARKPSPVGKSAGESSVRRKAVSLMAESR
jgi:multidrug efflux system membrane fusion protein